MSSLAEPVREQLVALLPRLRRFARALARNPQHADDLVQIAIERALARLQEWKRDRRFDLWMFAILRSAWIDESRSRRRRDRLHVVSDATGTLASGRSEPLLPRLPIEGALARLPDEQRLVVALVLVEGMSYREAADVLDVPVSTLTSRLAHAREMLEPLLVGREGEA